MERLVVMGKGGIGKSFIAAHLSAIYGCRGRKVLLVGCDPKHDSSILLTDGRRVRTVAELGIERADQIRLDQMITRGKYGVDCIEAGGPEPGVGCAGRGIIQVLDSLRRLRVLVRNRYDTAIFDVLGDVVCGGFAVPLRRGFGDKVLIVVSEELMSLYAANNIARAVKTYAANGVRLAGLIANLRDRQSHRALIERFARRIDTQVIGFIPQAPVVRRAEYARRTLLESAPDSAILRRLRGLAGKVLAIRARDCRPPTPLDEEGFLASSRAGFRADRPKPKAPAISPPADAATPPPDRETVWATDPGRLARLTALLRLAPGWVLTGVCRGEEGRLRIRLDLGRKNSLSVGLKPRRLGGALVDAGDFGLCVEGMACVPPELEGVLRAWAARLVSVKLPDLFALAPPSPALAPPPAEQPPQPQPPAQAGPAPLSVEQLRRLRSVPRPSFNTAPEEGWGRFIYMKAGDDLTRFSGSVGRVIIEHSDRECQFDQFPWGPLNLFSYGRHNAAAAGPEAQRVLVTDLGEREAVFGGVARLRIALEEAVRLSPRPQCIAISNKCLPMITGDDVTHLAREFSRKHGIPVLVDDNNGRDDSLLTQALARLLRAESGTRKPQAARTVNLIGFIPGQARDELTAMLRSLGLGINLCLIPEWDLAALGRLRRARVQVLAPRVELAGLYEDAFLRLGVPLLLEEAPYGLVRTRCWLERIAAAAGADTRRARAIAADAGQAAAHQQRLRPEAAAFCLGVVADRVSLPMLLHPPLFDGLPLLSIVREMGFSLELILQAPGTDAARAEVLRQLGSALGRSTGGLPDQVRAQWFESQKSLEGLLDASTCAAVYSDIALDERLFRNGKARFSRADFEMGFAGFARSTRRLLATCRLPFFRRYGKRRP